MKETCQAMTLAVMREYMTNLSFHDVSNALAVMKNQELQNFQVLGNALAVM